MGVGTLTQGRHLPKVRALRSTRLGAAAPPEEDHLPLFDGLTSASLTNMLYPFSTPNEIEQCLAAADMSWLKSLPSFNLSVQMMKSCDFLKNDCEKSESNWLVTPPDSPLFPALELDQLPVMTRRVHILRKRKSKPKSPLSKESQHTAEETSSNSQEKDMLAVKMGSNSQTTQKKYQKQDSKRKLESSQGKKIKENQKSRINDNTYVTKPPGKRQKNGKLEHE